MIEVLSSTALSTVQDLGRTGSLRWGVGTAGAMDPLALAAGNLLLGNDANAAAVEIPVFPFGVRFAEDCAFALTGADCVARLDDQPLLPWWAHQARAGQVLTLGPPPVGVWRASRAYLCLAGGVDVPQVLGSRSTSPWRRARPSWPPNAPRSCVLRDPNTSGTSTPPPRHR